MSENKAQITLQSDFVAEPITKSEKPPANDPTLALIYLLGAGAWAVLAISQSEPVYAILVVLFCAASFIIWRHDHD